MNKVAWFRKRVLKKTQNEMAELLHITQVSYSLKETGKIKFNQSEMESIKAWITDIHPEVTIDDIFFNSAFTSVLSHLNFENWVSELPEPHRRINQLAHDATESILKISKTLDVSYDEALEGFKLGLTLFQIEKDEANDQD